MSSCSCRALTSKPKLLLPLNGRPLILHTIEAWRGSRVDHVLVVVRQGDEALAEAIQSVNADLVIPKMPPPDMKAAERRKVEAVTPLKRWGGPQEIVKAVFFLIDSDFITGECVRDDGGRHLK